MGKFEMFYSVSGCETMTKSNDYKKLLQIAVNLKLSFFEIFNDKDGHFHSTADEKYLIAWYDVNSTSYWFNRQQKSLNNNIKSRRLEFVENNFRFMAFNF